jgi:threonine aldolase
MSPTIDLRSDTVTRPTPAMRRAMAEAEVGDDVLDGDPTVRRLEERVAAMLGKERALFFPSGTMANQTAIWVLAERGTEVYADAGAHVVHYEMAATAALGGVQLRTVLPSGDVMTAEDLEDSLRPPSRHAPRAALLCIENTHNGAGGRVTPLAGLRALQEVAAGRGLPVHLDGARLWNAAAALGVSLDALASTADTVMLSFSKGLGAPVGAALVGSSRAIESAHGVRKRFGGGMRQSGILAAGALHALDHHLERLPEDHEHARLLASAAEGVHGIRVVPPDTNIVMLDLPAGADAYSVVDAAARLGVLLTPWSRTRIRAVTHLDVDAGAVLKAAEVLGAVMGDGNRESGIGNRKDSVRRQ